MVNLKPSSDAFVENAHAPPMPNRHASTSSAPFPYNGTSTSPIRAPLVPGQYPADVGRESSGGPMPICEIDPWRIQYFTHACCPAEVRIPTEDSDAWTWNPRHRWVYDRIAIALSQGLAAGAGGGNIRRGNG